MQTFLGQIVAASAVAAMAMALVLLCCSVDAGQASSVVEAPVRAPTHCTDASGCMAQIQQPNAWFDCDCNGTVSAAQDFTYDFTNDVETAGFFFWNISTVNSHVDYAVTLTGTDSPSEESGKDASGPLGIIATPFQGTFHTMSLHANFTASKPNDTESAYARASLGWIQCYDRLNAVRASATYMPSNKAKIALTWTNAAPSSPFASSLTYAVLRKLPSESNFTTIASGLNVFGYDDTVDMVCAAQAEYTVVASFTQGKTTRACLRAYESATVALSAPPAAPGMPTVSFDSLTTSSAHFRWGKTAGTNGCSNISYALTVRTFDEQHVVAHITTEGVNSTNATVIFSPALSYDTVYLMEVVAQSPAGVSTGSQSDFTSPSQHKNKSRKRTGVAVGVSAAIIAVIAIAAFIFKKRQRNAYHSI